MSTTLGEQVHETTRGLRTTSAIVLVCLALALAKDALDVSAPVLYFFALLAAALACFAAVAHARYGFESRPYHVINRAETLIHGVGLAAMVASGRQAANVLWIFYFATLVHAGRAAIYPRFNTFVFALAPLVPAVVFAWRSQWSDALVVMALAAGSLSLHDALLRASHRFALLTKKQSITDERLRIARDLHDGLGAQLNAMVWAARVLQQRQPGEAIDRLERGLSRSLDELSTLVWATREEMLGFHAFVAHAQARLRVLFEDTLPVRVHVSGADAPLRGEVAVNALNILLEAVRNATQHSGGSSVEARLEHTGVALRVSVQDNGHGLPAAQPQTGFGLLHMRERAAHAGGTLVMESAASGTRVVAEFPG